jgi:hypothetical protein
MAKAATSTRHRIGAGRRPEVLGVTSDGVEIIKPVRGHRNLTDAQVRAIVKRLLEARDRRRLETVE